MPLNGSSSTPAKPACQFFGKSLMTSAASQFQVLNVVALKMDLSEHNLTAGQVGTPVEHLAPNIYEVDFSDDDG
jgi:hypothetical protein